MLDTYTNLDAVYSPEGSLDGVTIVINNLPYTLSLEHTENLLDDLFKTMVEVL